ncbi:hypothetical protein B0H11DRAFT_2292901 [Mycena galericulata]|nr:hypothetical protein B0H11DRAFT_2292901 [Mycena galericulata]
MLSISISPTSQAAAIKDDAASHRRVEALVGGIAGGFSLLTLLIITGTVLRRRRLQRDRRDSQFLVDPEAVVVSPFEPRDSVGFGSGVTHTDGEIAEKALRRQARQIQERWKS